MAVSIRLAMVRAALQQAAEIYLERCIGTGILAAARIDV